MTDAEIDYAFSPEVEAEFAREWQASIDRPIDAGLKPQPKVPKAARKTVR